MLKTWQQAEHDAEIANEVCARAHVLVMNGNATGAQHSRARIYTIAVAQWRQASDEANEANARYCAAVRAECVS